eukprot:1106080-Amphidinium_carterae.2
MVSRLLKARHGWDDRGLQSKGMDALKVGALKQELKWKPKQAIKKKASKHSYHVKCFKLCNATLRKVVILSGLAGVKFRL